MGVYIWLGNSGTVLSVPQMARMTIVVEEVERSSGSEGFGIETSTHAAE